MRKMTDENCHKLAGAQEISKDVHILHSKCCHLCMYWEFCVNSKLQYPAKQYGHCLFVGQKLPVAEGTLLQRM